MSKILGFFKDGTNLLIMLVIIGVTVGVFTLGKGFFTDSNKKMTVMTDNISQTQFNDYNGTTVKGMDVIAAINTKASAECTVSVKIGTTPAVYNGTTKYNITSKTDVNYIEPSANYTASLVTNTTTKAVTGLSFVIVP